MVTGLDRMHSYHDFFFLGGPASSHKLFDLLVCSKPTSHMKEGWNKMCVGEFFLRVSDKMKRGRGIKRLSSLHIAWLPGLTSARRAQAPSGHVSTGL